MARKLLPTLFTVVVLIGYSIYFMRTTLWIGVALLLMAGLMALAYLSPAFDSLLAENGVYVSGFLVIFFTLFGISFYLDERFQFALIIWGFAFVSGILLWIDIWHERNFG